MRIRIENRRRRADGTYTDWRNYDITDDAEKAGRLIGKFPEFYRAVDPESGEPLAYSYDEPASRTRSDVIDQIIALLDELR